jgi:hypothetical protein
MGFCAGFFARIYSKDIKVFEKPNYMGGATV